MSVISVKLTGRARRHLDATDRWWRKNRSASRTRVSEEFSRIVSLLVESPGLGKRYQVIDDQEIRRVPFRKTPYYLYYCVQKSGGEIWIVAVWSAERKHGPLLKLPPEKRG